MSKSKNDENQLVTYTLRMPIDVHTKFKTKLASERKNMRDVILDSIMDYLSKSDNEEMNSTKKLK